MIEMPKNFVLNYLLNFLLEDEVMYEFLQECNFFKFYVLRCVVDSIHFLVIKEVSLIFTQNSNSN